MEGIMDDLTVFLAVLLVSVLATALAESILVGARVRLESKAIALRLGAHVLVFCVLFVLVWRPFWAGATLFIAMIIICLISNRKRQILGEPLVFSDFALVRNLLRYPEIYYADIMKGFRGPTLILATLGVSGCWYASEQPLFIASTAALAASAFGTPLVLAFGWMAMGSKIAGRAAASVAPHPALVDHVDRFGILATLLLYTIRWRRQVRHKRPALANQTASTATERDQDLGTFDAVVVVQLESFMDPSQLGKEIGRQVPMPGLDAARARAFQYGELEVPCHGAYTMRSEAAVLTGVSEDALGFERYDPYLSITEERVPTLPALLRDAGYRTVFMHPFFGGFFSRDRVMPQLGFQQLIMGDQFEAADRHGPYVADPAVVERILVELDRFGKGCFIFAVTMENHGPWPDGRLEGAGDPLACYLAHLESTDHAIIQLIEGLSSQPGRTLLCLYGDHPPSLPGIGRDPSPRTDYMLLALSDDEHPASPRQATLNVAELGRTLRRTFARFPKGAPVDGKTWIRQANGA